MKKLYRSLCVCLVVLPISLSAATSPVVISEFMASNRNTNLLNVLFGPTAFPGAPDWIEIRNVSDSPVNLLNWALTDNPGNPFKWRFPETNINAGSYMVIAASGMDRKIPGAPLHTGFSLDAGGEYLALVQPNGEFSTQFAPAPQATNVSYGFGISSSNRLFIATNAPARLQIPNSPADGTNWTYAGFNDTSWTSGLNGVGFGGGATLAPLIKTDVRLAMSNVNASAYIRIPFTVPDPTNVNLLVLRLRYDDGFIAFVNGMEVLRVNAPDPSSWNSTATSAHAGTTVEEFRIGASALLPGNNVLAIQGLNLSATDPDFLVQAELSGVYSETEDELPNYLLLPTPGSPNSAPATRGPQIREVTHTPNVPTEDEDLKVTAQVSQTFETVGSVSLFYRFMFETNLQSTPMVDNGTQGDDRAGDRIFTAILPAAANTTHGQMIRYYVRAVDMLGQASRWPPFQNAGSTEYLGTIVEPVGLTSKLPIVHLFAPTTVLGPGPTTGQSGADSQAGARGVSLFYDGEFYDNIHMQLRGNSTSGFNKKSHRVEFNADHQFRHSGPGPRLRKTSFVADYPDPTYMRQGLGYWLCELMGSPAPFYIPHRLQLNGAFYQLANHNDVHGEELLDRLGYDPNGALYNAAGQVTPGRASTGGFEKKTRRWDNDNDYTAMSTAIGEALALGLRETNFFELFDIPNALNYLVSARWFHENDDVWANMSLYHDNDGDNQWKIVPFDVNLSWGAIFYEGGVPSVIEGVQATNDIHKAHPLYGSSATPALNSGNYNRVYDTVFRSPVLREMFLRRLRTLMDTYAQPPETHPLARVFEKKVLDWRDLIAEEAAHDRAKWAWPPKGGQCNFDPGILLHPGVDAMIKEFIEKRRTHFFVKHSVTNASPSFPVGITKTNNAGIPLPQPANVAISIVGVEYNPASGNQSQEYIVLTNGNSYAVDISDWTLSGGVEFTFHQGTVIPANRAAYLSPDVRAFRARTSGPRGGQGLFVIGPYSGQLSARGEGLAIHDTTGRLVHTNSYPGNPSLAQQYLRVTEIMYNPAPLASSPATDPQEFEYIELKNLSAGTLSLAGVRFAEGIEFDFGSSAVPSLGAGQRVLVVKNAAAFALKNGGGLPVAGQFNGNLDNAGERLRLLDSANEEILDFRYNNSWYPVTDGVGFSLVVVDENAEPDAWGSASQWRPSGSTAGTPGQQDPPAATFAPILINEVLSSSDASLQDYIELFNPTASDVNIGGWYISDDFTNAYKFRIPADTIIPAGGYQTFYEPQFNPTPGVPPSFSFSSRGDDAYIFSANSVSNLTGYIYGYDFGAAGTNVSFGRYIDSQTNLHFVAQSARTPNAANALPKVGPVVISEIMYHPVDEEGGADNSPDEFIELRNTTGAALPLFDPSFPINTWRLRGGVDFDLPENVTLPANGHLILANISPSDTAALAAFRTLYGVPPSVIVLGPYSGKLDNSADSIRLLRPDGPEADEVPYVLVDEVDYADGGAWAVLADGTGASLQRLAVGQYGNDPVNWTAAAPTAGADRSAGDLPVILTQPSNVAGIASQSASLSVVANGVGLRYQWFKDDAAIPGATSSILALSGLDMEDAGQFFVIVYNNSGAVRSSNATLSILFAAYFSRHPVSTQMFVRPEPTAAPTTNATFTVAASSLNPPISYQWRANGVNIPGATSSTLTIENVTTNDFAEYTCAVTDQAGTVVSEGAWLYPMVRPAFVYQPVSQNVAPGTLVTLSAEVTGFPPPFTYEWRLGSIGVLTNVVDSTVNLFSLLSPTSVNASNRVRVVVKNRANTTPGIPSGFADITSVLDTDGDGIIDSLEDSIPGLNKTNPADAAADNDGDGMANGEEIIAGTDMNDANSYLKVTSTAGSGAVTLTIATKAHRSYTIQYSDDLIVWNKLDDLAGRATDQVRSVSDSSSQPHRFYRVAVPGQP